MGEKKQQVYPCIGNASHQNKRGKGKKNQTCPVRAKNVFHLLNAGRGDSGGGAERCPRERRYRLLGARMREL